MSSPHLLNGMLFIHATVSENACLSAKFLVQNLLKASDLLKKIDSPTTNTKCCDQHIAQNKQTNAASIWIFLLYLEIIWEV